MRHLTFSMLLAGTLASTTALGRPIVTSPPPADDGPGNGVQLELGLLGTSGLVSVTNGIVGAGAAAGLLTGLPLSLGTPAVSVGYQWNQNAVLVGLGLAGGGGSEFLFNIGPTVRRYFSPLRTGGFSTFAEGSIDLVLAAPSSGPGSASFGFGLDAGVGGEWLFIKNFGLFAKALLGYQHYNADGVNVDGVGLSGIVGLSVHL